MVHFRKRCSGELIEKANEILFKEYHDRIVIKPENPEETPEEEEVITKGKLIVDATCCPADIRYPNDISLLNEARENSEKIIDILFPLDTESRAINPGIIAMLPMEISSLIRRRGGHMEKRVRYSQEVKARAVKFVFECTDEHGSQWQPSFLLRQRLVVLLKHCTDGFGNRKKIQEKEKDSRLMIEPGSEN